MKVTARTQTIGIALYSLPYLAVIAISLFMWVGTVEFIVACIALLPAALHFFGVRWCRHVVGGFSAISFLVCSMIPFIRSSGGSYFWLLWVPIWLVFAFASFISFMPVRQPPHDAA